jgi:acetoin utilization deacetylase AcuC-like enzyme
MNKSKVAIYYDPLASTNHDPRFGSLESGDRVKLDYEKYQYKGFILVASVSLHPFTNDSIKKVHSENPVVKYLMNEFVKPNKINRFFRIGLKSMSEGNCYRCTSVITKSKCDVCKANRNLLKFYKYIFMIDKNVVDSDTTYITDTTLEAIRSAVSSVITMIDDIHNENINYGFCIIRPPGHHASNNKSGGFCIVNNIAICAEYAIEKGFKRIFIFDCDAHHGNGTQDIFYKRSDVFYCSIHTAEAYPKTGLPTETGEGNGLGYNLNIIVDIGIDADDYLNEFYSKVLPQIKSYNPDLILVSLGFDGLESDPMHLMKLRPETYYQLTRSLISFNTPIGLLLEGGYNTKEMPDCIDAVLGALRLT